MKTPVYLYSNLQRYTGDQTIVETDGSTVGQCLTQLIHKYPDLGPVILEKSGKLSPYVYISINLESARSETLERPLTEADRIYIILIVAGG